MGCLFFWPEILWFQNFIGFVTDLRWSICVLPSVSKSDLSSSLLLLAILISKTSVLLSSSEYRFLRDKALANSMLITGSIDWIILGICYISRGGHKCTIDSPSSSYIGPNVGPNVRPCLKDDCILLCGIVEHIFLVGWWPDVLLVQDCVELLRFHLWPVETGGRPGSARGMLLLCIGQVRLASRTQVLASLDCSHL